MAISVIQSVSMTADNNEYSPNDQASLSQAISAGSNRVVIAVVGQGFSGNSTTGDTVTIGGQTLTQLGSKVNYDTSTCVSIYYALESTVASMSGTTVSFTYSTADSGSGISVWEIHGASQTPPTLNTDTDITGDSIGDTAMSTENGAFVGIGCTVDQTLTNPLTPPTGFTGTSAEEWNGLNYFHSAYDIATGSTIDAEYDHDTESLSGGAWAGFSWPAAADSPTDVWQLYSSAIGYVDDNTIQQGHTFKVALLDNTHTLNLATHSVRAHVATDIIGSDATVTMATSASGGLTVWTAGSATWAGAVSPNYLVLYDDSTTSPTDALVAAVELSNVQTAPAGSTLRLPSGIVFKR